MKLCVFNININGEAVISTLGLVGIFLFLCEVRETISHGRMMSPPARNAMWRFGYSSPVNYDDNQNWCGGASVMINENHGKCGICGDNYADSKPRAHEAGGMYGSGIIVRRYAPGQLVDVEIELTANHQGTFTFKLCPVNSLKVEVTQECLDGNQLELFNAYGKPSKKYVITSPEKRKTFNLQVKLPQSTSCSHCVLQWTYVAANTWGTCKNGTEAVGCGPQETFINCADIAIIPNSGGRPPAISISQPNSLYYSEDLKTGEKRPNVVTSQVCLATGTYTTVPGINDWCHTNCLRYPPNCPEDKCQCLQGCDAVGAFKEKEGSDVYCMQHCFTYPRSNNCTTERCTCY